MDIPVNGDAKKHNPEEVATDNSHGIYPPPNEELFSPLITHPTTYTYLDFPPLSVHSTVVGLFEKGTADGTESLYTSRKRKILIPVTPEIEQQVQETTAEYTRKTEIIYWKGIFQHLTGNGSREKGTNRHRRRYETVANQHKAEKQRLQKFVTAQLKLVYAKSQEDSSSKDKDNADPMMGFQSDKQGIIISHQLMEFIDQFLEPETAQIHDENPHAVRQTFLEDMQKFDVDITGEKIPHNFDSQTPYGAIRLTNNVLFTKATKPDQPHIPLRLHSNGIDPDFVESNAVGLIGKFGISFWEWGIFELEAHEQDGLFVWLEVTKVIDEIRKFMMQIVWPLIVWENLDHCKQIDMMAQAAQMFKASNVTSNELFYTPKTYMSKKADGRNEKISYRCYLFGIEIDETGQPLEIPGIDYVESLQSQAEVIDAKYTELYAGPTLKFTIHETKTRERSTKGTDLRLRLNASNKGKVAEFEKSRAAFKESDEPGEE